MTIFCGSFLGLLTYSEGNQSGTVMIETLRMVLFMFGQKQKHRQRGIWLAFFANTIKRIATGLLYIQNERTGNYDSKYKNIRTGTFRR